MYYVVSAGEAPFRIYFTLEDAMKSENTYIDVFNAEGLHVESYMFGLDGYVIIK